MLPKLNDGKDHGEEIAPPTMEVLQKQIQNLHLGATNLLNRTKERRVSVIPRRKKKASVTLDDARDINTAQELSIFVEKDAVTVMEMINDLREERDAGIHHAKQLDKYGLTIGHYEKESTTQ